MSTIYIEDPLSKPRFGHAWRDKDGSPHASVHLGASFVAFSSAADALELAALLVTAANAITALPAPEGDTQ